MKEEKSSRKKVRNFTKQQIETKSKNKANKKLKELGYIAVNTHLRKENLDAMKKYQKENNLSNMRDTLNKYIEETLKDKTMTELNEITVGDIKIENSQYEYFESGHWHNIHLLCSGMSFSMSIETETDKITSKVKAVEVAYMTKGNASFSLQMVQFIKDNAEEIYQKLY